MKPIYMPAGYHSNRQGGIERDAHEVREMVRRVKTAGIDAEYAVQLVMAKSVSAIIWRYYKTLWERAIDKTWRRWLQVQSNTDAYPHVIADYERVEDERNSEPIKRDPHSIDTGIRWYNEAVGRVCEHWQAATGEPVNGIYGMGSGRFTYAECRHMRDITGFPWLCPNWYRHWRIEQDAELANRMAMELVPYVRPRVGNDGSIRSEAEMVRLVTHAREVGVKWAFIWWPIKPGQEEDRAHAITLGRVMQEVG